jgi:hypothetical protein
MMSRQQPARTYQPITTSLQQKKGRPIYRTDLKCAISCICVYYFIIFSCCLHSGIKTTKRSNEKNPFMLQIDNWSHLLRFTSVKRTFAVLKYASDNTCKQKYLPNEQPTQDFIFELKIEKLFKRKEHNVTFDEKILGYDKCTENGVILVFANI